MWSPEKIRQVILEGDAGPVQLLLKSLDHGDEPAPEVERAVVQTLQELYPEAWKTRPATIEELKRFDETGASGRKNLLAWVLRRKGPDGAAGQLLETAMIHDPSPSVREYAVEQFAQTNGAVSARIKKLARVATRDAVGPVREAAALALGRLGRGCPPSQRRLILRALSLIALRGNFTESAGASAIVHVGAEDPDVLEALKKILLTPARYADHARLAVIEGLHHETRPGSKGRQLLKVLPPEILKGLPDWACRMAESTPGKCSDEVAASHPAGRLRHYHPPKN